jgi:hypothetical protein
MNKLIIILTVVLASCANSGTIAEIKAIHDINGLQVEVSILDQDKLQLTNGMVKAKVERAFRKIKKGLYYPSTFQPVNVLIRKESGQTFINVNYKASNQLGIPVDEFEQVED